MKKYRIIANTLEISKNEWLRLRKDGIGGSDIGAIMGVNPFSSPFNVFVDKTTDFSKDLSDNEAIYWGTVLEDVVAKEFERRTGKKVSRLNSILASKETPFAYANIDRRIMGEKAGLECKTTNAFNSDEWKDDEIPASYICQCQWYMYVTGWDRWYIACLIGGQHFVYKEIERDDELIGCMLKKAKHFWTDNVLRNVPPSMDGSAGCGEYLKKEYVEDNGLEIMLSRDVFPLVDKLAELKALEKNISLQQTELENKIKQYMGEYQTAVSDKYTVFWKTQNGAPKFERELLAEKIGADELKKYYTPTRVRKFIIKENR